MMMAALMCVSLCVTTGCLSTTGSAPQAPAKVERPLVVSRAQMKYGLQENYLRRWVDRPLFQNSGLRSAEDTRIMPAAAYRQMAEIAHSYKLDGFAFFPETAGRMDVFDLHREVAPEGFGLLPEFIPSQNLEAKRAMLEAALAHPDTLKIDGRIVISGYRSDVLSAAEWANLLGEFRQAYGQDTFIFLPDLSVLFMSLLYAYQEERDLSSESVAKVKQKVRAYVEVFDGFYFAGAASLKLNRSFDTDFYREVLIPLAKELVAESPNKYLGLSATIGHMNCTRLGYTLSEEGTRTLRESLETALAAKPDLIVIPEWDEQNENTSIRPTVYNGLTTKRLIRYYMTRLQGDPLAPLPNDFTPTPNLMISHRKSLTLGEVLQVELLHVPDSELGRPYTARVDLYNENDQLVHALGAVRFSGDRLEAQLLEVPSELLAGNQLVMPVVTVGAGHNERRLDEGFHYINLRMTWNWDYKWVKTALRDLAMPSRFRVGGESSDRGEGLVTMAGAISVGEAIASVEVLDDAMVTYAVNPADDAWRERRNDLLVAVEFRRFDRGTINGKLSVSGATAVWRDEPVGPWSRYEVAGNSVTIASRVDWVPRILYVAVARDQAPDAMLEIETNLVTTRIPVARLVANDIYSETHAHGLTVTASRYLRQPDHPRHLGKDRTTFLADIKPDWAGSILHVRMITESGKIYRSKPMVLPAASQGAITQLPVWSDTQDEVVTVEVDDARIPDLRYTMSDEYGSVFHTEAGRSFWGQLGGFTDSVTARGGDGGLDGSPFSRRTRYRQGATQMAPQWQEMNGRQALAFNGTGTFVALPQGALPRRAPFRLSFDIWPADVNEPQILFAHHGFYIGSLVLRLEDGYLRGLFANDQLVKHIFEADTALKAGQWANVQVRYDLERLSVLVDGEVVSSMPCSRPGLYDVTSVLGGYGGEPGEELDFLGTTGWFRGYISNFSLRHHPGQEP